jgi:hypothetical protein
MSTRADPFHNNNSDDKHVDVYSDNHDDYAPTYRNYDDNNDDDVNSNVAASEEVDDSSDHGHGGGDNDCDNVMVHDDYAPTYLEYDDNNDDVNSCTAASEGGNCGASEEVDDSSDDGHGGGDNDCDNVMVHDDYAPTYLDYDDNNDDVNSCTAASEGGNCGASEEGDDSSDDGHGGGDNDYDNIMENVEMAMLTDTASIDVDKSLVIRLLAVLIPLKIYLSSRMGGGYTEKSKQDNCALRLCNMLVWTALNSKQKKILDETTLLPWMEEVLKLEYIMIDSYCQYLEETKLYSAHTIRAYLYDYGLVQ